MNKYNIITLGLSMSLSLPCFAESIEIPPTYHPVAQVYDWGTSIDRVVINLNQSVKASEINADTFKVDVKRFDNRLDDPLFLKGSRQVSQAYVSDNDGNPSDESNYVTLVMPVSPDNNLALTLNYYDGLNIWTDNQYTITQQKPIQTAIGAIKDLSITEKDGITRKLMDDFQFDKMDFGQYSLNYASYSPVKDNHKNPLIIWLHGGGEGGSDPVLPLAGNKSVNFITPEIQNIYDGAYVLIPQAPTRWMDGFTGKSDGSSIYQESLMKLIEEHVAENPDIDSKRIYVGGASNGGYMTMLLIRDYPQYFAAAFPVCEGLNDYLISDAQLTQIAKTPSWFIAAKNDETLPVLDNAVPTYIRLLESGASNVHLSLYNDVQDKTGLYKQEDGQPYQYNGHFSWIHTFNNDMTTTYKGKNVSLMEWMAKQKR